MATGQDIVDEVRAQLLDENVSNQRWSDAEMLRYVNAAQRQIVVFLPEANIIEFRFAPSIANGARQTLPADAVKFIQVRSGFDNENSIPGPNMRYVELDAMDAFMPLWQYSLGGQPNIPVVEDEYEFVHYEHYMHDPREPKVFYLYPLPDNNSQDILVIYSQLPPDLGSLASALVLTDEYQNAMIDYVMFRAMFKDGRYGVTDRRSRELWDNFRASLGLKIQMEVRADAKTNAPPEGP